MSIRRSLSFALMCASFGCSEAVIVPEPDAASAEDASIVATPSTIRAVSEEIDLGAVDDRALGFVRERDVLVARAGARTTTISARGVAIEVEGGAVRLGHATVSIDDVPVALGAPTVDTNARAIRSANEAVEIIEGHAAHVEQRWRFATRPSGAVSVRVPVEGAVLEHEDARGLHLSIGETRIVYSHAELVDAGGARTPVSATFEDGAVVLRVSRTLLAATRFPAVLDPVVGPEIAPSAAPSLVRNTQYESSARVLMFGERIVALWQLNGGVGCAYIDPAETTITRAPRMLSPAISGIYGFLATRSGSTGIAVVQTSSDVRYLRFDQSCTALDAQPRLLDSSSVSNVDEVAPYDGGFLVSWATSSNTRVIRAIDLGGTVLWTAPASLTDAGGAIRYPRLFASGADVLVFYRVLRSLRVQRLSTAGVWTQSTPVILDDGSGGVYAADPNVRAVRTDTRVVVTWDGGRATRSLASFDPTTLAQLTSRPESLFASPHLPHVNTVGGQIVLSAIDNADNRVRIRRLDAATLVPEGTDAVSTTPASYEGVFGIATGTQTVAAISLVIADQERDVLVVRSDAATTEFAMSYVLPVETIPQVASTGSGFMTTWARTYPSPARIRAAYVSSTGVVTPSTGIDVSTPSYQTLDPTMRSDIAASDTHYLVLYDTTSDIGTLLYAPPSTTPTDPYVNSVYGPRFAAVEVGGQLRTAFLTDSWSTATWRTAASPTNETGTYPVSNFIGPFAAAGTMVTVARSIDTVVGTAAGQSLTIPVVASEVALATSGTSYLLVFTTSGGAVGARLLSPTAGLLGSAIVLRSAGTAVAGLSTVWDGTRFVVAYVADGAIRAQRVDGSGVVVDVTPGTLVSGVAASAGTDMAADDAGRVMIVYGRDTTYDGLATIRVFARIVDFAANGADANGAACTHAWSCASGVCADGVCCDRACGGSGGVCEACSVAAGGATDGTCGPKVNAAVCRASQGPCDVAESCDGASAVCPPNGFANGTECNPAGSGACDAPDVCDGTTAACPARYRTVGTSCRTSADVCDVGETCTGLSSACPADGVASSNLTCRNVAGDCDVAERCTGSSKVCPADTFRSAAASCRAAGSACDREERCTGSTATCPNDAPALAGTACRGAASPCNPADFCDGASFACPADVPATADTSCRPATGPCDVAERCDGLGLECPPDAFQSATVTCRQADGACDVAEFCTGVNTSCPTDRVRPLGSTCRAIAGPCDVAEMCSGFGKQCPTNAFRPAETVCRDATGPCDVAETCDGARASCLADLHQRDGLSCDDGLVCNGDALCESGACVASEPLVCEAEQVCSELTGACEAPPSSDGGCSAAPPGRVPRAPHALFSLMALAVVATRRRSR